MGTFVATVNVTLKDSVLDPQGKAVLSALESSGFKEALDIRVGKTFVLKLSGSNQSEAEKKIREMCDKLLVNPVIEKYWISNLTSDGTHS